ncbi:MBL fold metallo-hydrolase [Winogradskyella sp. DF17]|uniref:MBL fold metallo-hydrolase n=1 Tax=Winogradskyella pelagia TaxID=2819984 RepID=A0ABS3T271_9FLAO|nr:MBL fold metallo-hydrolase [Winogradskyella sp. DF17]MBO3116848.1 MBL fold metallo-hydrolase [Winogradskyella sp. DF17]
MKFLKSPLFLIAIALFFTCKNKAKSDTSEAIVIEEKDTKSVKIIPINHGTLVLESGDNVVYVDPVGGVEAFNNQKQPTLVLITDIHGDHLSTKTLEALNLKGIPVVAPQAVIDQIPSTALSDAVMLANGQKKTISNIDIEAIPMYNLREEALKFHEKGRGNGYVLTLGGERIYISGDTEDIPEMRGLKNIDKAMVCMNLPYTMPIESAASAVLDFKPKQVIPYHYRGTEGLSDVNKFKNLVETADKSIEVRLMKWY